MYREYISPPALTEAFAKIQRERWKKDGRASNVKGEEAEARCLKAVLALCTEERWLHAGRLANRKEDARGIDVVVESEVGLLYVQVKSSVFSAMRFRRRRPRAKAIVIVIEPDMSDDKIKNKARDALSRLRKYFLKVKRGQV